MIDLSDSNEKLLTSFRADTIYLGTYKYHTTEEVIFSSKGLRLVAPHYKQPHEKTVLDIQKSEIQKLVYNFSAKSVLVIYVVSSCGKYVRESLEMSSNSEGMHDHGCFKRSN